MPLAIGRFTPTDYDTWHRVHVDSVQRFTAELGALSDVIHRDHADPRTVVVVMEIESVEKFQAFIATEAHQTLVSQATLEGPPVFWFVDRVEEVDLGGG
jgi:quinol monooxygenase YgiN